MPRVAHGWYVSAGTERLYTLHRHASVSIDSPYYAYFGSGSVTVGGWGGCADRRIANQLIPYWRPRERHRERLVASSRFRGLGKPYSRTRGLGPRLTSLLDRGD